MMAKVTVSNIFLIFWKKKLFYNRRKSVHVSSNIILLFFTQRLYRPQRPELPVELIKVYKMIIQVCYYGIAYQRKGEGFIYLRSFRASTSFASEPFRASVTLLAVFGQGQKLRFSCFPPAGSES